MSSHFSTLILGAGLAGLSCANRLAREGGRFLLVEATDRVGGRVRTDHVDGFTLDHGFQVLLTAYPACREWLDYEALDLRPFEPGVVVRQRGKFAILGDPWRRPSQFFSTVTNPVGSLADKFRVAKLRRASRRGTLDDLYRRAPGTTLERLRAEGFSEHFIDQFFRPFLGGVFLDESLQTPARMLEFVFRMFATGDIAVPTGGMEAIPLQLASRLPAESIRFGDAAVEVAWEASTADASRFRVSLSSGDEVTADHLVVAVESPAAARLLGEPALETPWSGTTTLYFAADMAPDPKGKWLILRGDEIGPIQTATVLSEVAPEYAPPGRALVSVSVSSTWDDPETGDTVSLEAAVRAQLKQWFGPATAGWEFLRAYRVPYGLPKTDLDPVLGSPMVRSLKGREVPAGRLWICGDFRETPSIQGAMNSGLRVAESLQLVSATDLH